MAAFLSLALPATMLTEASGRAWTARFFDGLRALSESHGVPLAGGDTARIARRKSRPRLRRHCADRIRSQEPGAAPRRSICWGCSVCDRASWRGSGGVIQNARRKKTRREREDDGRPPTSLSRAASRRGRGPSTAKAGNGMYRPLRWPVDRSRSPLPGLLTLCQRSNRLRCRSIHWLSNSVRSLPSMRR